MFGINKETFYHFVEDVNNFFAKKKDVPTKLSDLENDLPSAVSDWTQNDENAADYIKNRTHYSETVETDIEGMEFNISVGKNTTSLEHNLNIPFKLGQVWKVCGSEDRPTWSAIENVPVQQASDGTLYLGSEDLYNYTFYITPNSAKINSAWANMNYVSGVKIVCVSGTVTETRVHQLDEKYIPNSVRPFKIKVVYSAKTEEATASATIEEVDQALSEGRDIIVECQQDNILEAYRVLRLADVQSTPVGSQVSFTCAMSGVLETVTLLPSPEGEYLVIHMLDTYA